MITDSRRGVVQLWGRDFDMVPAGLSREQVVAFVTRLIEENRELSEKVKNLGFLQQLAQMTVAEADEMAAGMRQRAQEEAAAIVEAERQEAARIKAKASEDSRGLVAECRRRLEVRMKTQAERVSGLFLGQFIGVVSEVWAAAEGGQTETVPPAPAPAPAAATDRPGPACAGSADFSGKVDLAIIPPVDLAQLMNLRREIRAIPGLKILQIVSSQVRGTRISVVLTEPVALLSLLAAMPAVDRVSEAPVEVPAGDPPEIKGARRLTLRLAPFRQS